MTKLKLLLGSAAIFAATHFVSAGTYTFVTPVGATAGGQPVDATVTFTTGAGSLAVDLTNNIVDPTSIIQNISGVKFTFNTGQTTGSITSSSSKVRDIASDGTYTDSGPSSTGWGLDTGNPLVLTIFGYINPQQTIVGKPNASTNKYDTANSSIAGNGPHNPFLYGPSHFVLSISGLTAASIVNSTTFQFGTGPSTVTGTPGPNPTPVPAVPLPSAAWAGMALLGGLGFMQIRRLRRA